jgi:predicted TIM-barrel fold metal-dependent hydrolase
VFFAQRNLAKEDCFGSIHAVSMSPGKFSRREFLLTTAAAATASLAATTGTTAATPEPVIDIHQHTDYTGRTDEQMIAHQRKMGVTHSVLLPAGRFFNLEAGVSGNERAQEVSKRLPQEYSFFANEVPYLSDAREVIRQALKAGGIGIGEQKFQVDADSRAVILVAEIAQEFGVPVLLHFQFGRYNTGLEKFHRILEKFPKVNFIGHAQTWWANIDAKADQAVLYPKGPVTPGGITDRLLADYPNMFGDTSAGSGLNAFLRDEEFTRGFFDRHQDKLLFGSDCNDAVGEGDKCTGAGILAAIRRLAPDKAAERKILYENAKRVLKLKV